MYSDETRTDFLAAWSIYENKITNDFPTYRKDIKYVMQATKFKNDGNRLFKNGDLEGSKLLYFVALKYCPEGDDVQCQILGNLSAVCYQQDLYEDAIHYIDIVINVKPIDALVAKLYIRKVKALMKLGKEEEAKLINCTFDEIMEQKTKDMCIREMNNALKMKARDDDDDYAVLYPTCNNPTFLNVTEKACISKNDQFGRYVVAQKDIDKGELILVENPYIQFGNFALCDNCCNEIKRIVVCSSCSFAAYCSYKCKVASYINFHKWECVFFQYEFMKQCSIPVILAFRMLLKAVTSRFNIGIRVDQTIQKFGDAEENSPYVHTLHTNYSHIRTSEYFSGKVRTGVLLMCYLRKETNILQWIRANRIMRSETDSAMYTKLGAWFLQMLNILLFNGVDFNKMNKIDQRSICLFASYSMFNHSCIPNTVQFLSEGKMVLKACESIKAGEQIFVAYKSVLFYKKPRPNRQKILEECYNFKCACKACSNTEYDVIPKLTCKFCHSGDLDINCETKDIRCKACKEQYKEGYVMEFLEKFALIMETIFFPNWEIYDWFTIKYMENFMQMAVKCNVQQNTIIFPISYALQAQYVFSQGKLQDGCDYLSNLKSIYSDFDVIFQTRIFLTLEKYCREKLKGTYDDFLLIPKLKERSGQLSFFIDSFKALHSLCYPEKKSTRDRIDVVQRFFALCLLTREEDNKRSLWKDIAEKSKSREVVHRRDFQREDFNCHAILEWKSYIL